MVRPAGILENEKKGRDIIPVLFYSSRILPLGEIGFEIEPFDARGVQARRGRMPGVRPGRKGVVTGVTGQ